MKDTYSKEAQNYWNGEHIRFLGEGNKVPDVEERVKGAFDAGVRSVFEKRNDLYALDCFSKEVGQINFPKVTQ